MGVFYTFAGLQRLLTAMVGGSGVYGLADLTLGSPDMTLLGPITGLVAGDLIIGPGIPVGTYVVSVVGTAVVMSANATSAETNVNYSFVGPPISADGVQLDLLTGVIPQTPTTTYAEVTVATYDGYAPINPLTWQAALQDGTWAWIAAECETFIPADYTVRNTITGMAYSIPGVGAGPRILLATEVFLSPIVLAAEGQGVQVTPILPLPFDCTAAPPSPLAA